MKEKPSKKVEKSRKKGEVRTSMFVTKAVYDMCGQTSKRVGIPMRQIWEAGVIEMSTQTEDDIKNLLQNAGITPGWRTR